MPSVIHHILQIVLLVSLVQVNAVLADTLRGRVVGVSDGDTVTVLDNTNTQFKIRLMGIDAPEKRQAFGARSKQSLSDLLFNKQVEVEYHKTDRYGRTLGKIVVGGIDANLEQVKAGMAWHYKKYQKEQTLDDRSIYAQAEEQARGGNRGLWKDADPTPPWDWRRLQKVRYRRPY